MCGYCLPCPPPARYSPVTSSKPRCPKFSKRMAKIYIAVFLANFSFAFAMTMMFPFLPFMVEFLLPWLREEEALVSIYAGIIVSSLFLGRFLGNYVWGAVADRIGRKPVIIVSVLLIGIFSTVFGFSVTYEMAVITMVIVGLCHGIDGAMKAMISEVSDNSNQALGIGILGFGYGIGYIFGPAVSGAVSDPIGQYNLTIENDFMRNALTRFPYVLPCLMSLALCLMAGVSVFFLLPETLDIKRNLKRSEVSQKDIQQLLTSREETSSDRLSSTASDTEGHAEDNISNIETESHDITSPYSSLLIRNNSYDDNSSETIPKSNLYVSKPSLFDEEISSVNTGRLGVGQDGHMSKQSVDGCQDTDHQSVDVNVTSDDTDFEGVAEDDQTELLIGQCDSSSDVSKEPSEPPISAPRRRRSWEQVQAIRTRKSFKETLLTLLSFFCDLKPALSILLYCLTSFPWIGHNQIYPVWAKTSPHLGGLGFTLHEIGISLTITGVLLLPSSFLFPLVEKRLGLIRTFYVFYMILIPSVMLLPNIHYLLSYDLKWLVWILLCSILFTIELCMTVVFSTQLMLINNSVTFDKLGSINGLTMSLTSLVSCLSPIVCSLIYTASLSESAIAIGYPFDYRLVFLIFGLVALLCTLFAACLPTSINKQMIIADVGDL